MQSFQNASVQMQYSIQTYKIHQFNKSECAAKARSVLE